MVPTSPSTPPDFRPLQPGSCDPQPTGCQLPAPERLWVPLSSSRATRRAIILRRFAVQLARMDLGLEQAARVRR